MNRLLLSALCMLLGVQLGFAQGDDEAGDGNLVPNSDFENTKTKTLKTYGMLNDLTTDWFSATKAPADVFAEGVKGEKVSVPTNTYGKQEPSSGSVYAGFVGYTKDKKRTRSYLEVELTDELEKNQMYCVQFRVSLGDLSKYGVNHIGAVLSDRKIVQPNTGAMVRDIDIKDRSNKTYTTMDGWETVCGTIVGTGQEEYLIIGCFGGDTDLKIEKQKRPRDVTGAQVMVAYYYVDDVTVTPIDAKSQCACSPADNRQPDLIYGSSMVVSENMSDTEIIDVSAVYFAHLKRNLVSASENTLKKIATIMKENPSWKLEVIGHCDEDEFLEGKITSIYRDLGKKRAEQVARFLAAQGVPESRLIVVTKENTDPATTRDTEMSHAQNRRVVFSIRQ